MIIKDEEKSDDLKDNIQTESVSTDTTPYTSFSFSVLTKDAGKQSLKAVMWFSIVLVSFGLSNLILFVIALFEYGDKRFSAAPFIILFLGLVSIAFAVYKTYKYLLVDTLNVAYKYLTPLFKGISIKVIDKVVVGGTNLMGKHDVKKSLNMGNLMIEVYGKKLPNGVQKSVMFILKCIPFSDFLFTMRDDLKDGRKDNKTLSEMLYLQLDRYIKGIFNDNSMKWMAWLLPLNIILQILVLIFVE